ncbi:UDP-glycosyltransferase 90A1 [Dichanthelium oligosanthes]|uniref:Glycosyltransferase n=1 Tax=Dichanthelium oligosanthes TaxID=888268 RepID=A0A1E5VP14_9POAL|nr:UDP-glycosyltransferase 90A1 [Dichanthelium oligosanthes]
MALAAAASFPRGARDAQAQLPHVVIFSFMAKSHTIPLTHLAHLLRRRKLATVTFFTTPVNAAFVRAALSGADGMAVVELPFPDHVIIPGVPTGAECVEALDSLFFLPAFVEAVSLLRPRFEEALTATRPPASVIVADAFLYWAPAAAAALGVRTLAFFGANVFAHVVREVCLRDNPAAALSGGNSDAVFTVPEFPHVQLLLEDIPFPFNEPDLTVAASIREMDGKIGKAIADSHGLIVNTFDAMERRYIEHWNRHVGPRAWPVGPLCRARPTPISRHGSAPAWMRWLDEKAAAGHGVLYVALGTMAAVSVAQLREVADGLEKSEQDFLWAVRPVDADLGTGFEERVRGRGMVAREWVDQCAILRHGGVRGFVSHCGWNSVIESVSAGVPLAAWPMSAEQPLNAKLVVDELKIGIRVSAKDGTGSGLVRSEEIARVATELMAGKKGVEVARNMAALGAKAREATEEGGSSWNAVQELITGLNLTA